MSSPTIRRHNGAAIRAFRVIRGKSRDELAQAVNVSYPYFANIENEYKDAKPELLHRIALVLDVPVAAIVRQPLLANSEASA